MFQVPERFRITTGTMRTSAADGNNGCFNVTSIKFQRPLSVLASDGAGWEHVSVSLHDRTPTWNEMSFIKDLFWGDEDLVIQMHPPKSEYVNVHPHCLHLWRKCDTNDFCEMPHHLLVGPKG